MIKEKIVKLFKDMGDKQDDGQYTLHETYFESIADTLLEMFEHEKKEVAREIIGDLKGLLEGYVYTKENISLYEYYCKKYGVEL